MSFVLRLRLIKNTFAALIVASTLALTGTARGQFGEAAGIAEAMQADFFRRDLRILDEGLRLDTTQRVIVDALFGDYEAEFEAGLVRMRKRFEDMREQLQTGDQRRIMTLVFTPFKEWAVEKSRLGEQFLENVKVVLTQDQLDNWPSIDRRLYRERYLPKGRLSGESLNLFHIIRDMHLDERSQLQIQPVMEAYETGLDQALRRRQQSGTGAQNDMLDSMAEQDANKRMLAMDKFIKLQVAVRNVNDEYIERIAAVMPEELGRKFRASALERAYPRIYRETPVQKMFQQAKELKDLTPTVLQSIVELEISFLGELESINRQLYTALRQHEPADARSRAEDFDKRMAGQTIEPRVDPTQSLFGRRDEICREYAKRLQALLTPEQFASIPGAFRWVEMPQNMIDSGLGAEQKQMNQSKRGSGRGAANKAEDTMADQ